MTAPHLLIVDDDAALLKALPEALRLRMGNLRIETSETAHAALERISATDFDAIVTDIKMPGMDGLTLLHHIRALRPETPTLLITGHGDHDLAIQALRGGAFDFIQKPIDRDYVVASLERAFQVRTLRRQVEEQRLALERHAAQLEQAVEERTRELQEANQAKDTFLSIASHELRTPLTTLKGLAQLTHRRLRRTHHQEAIFLERMERAIGRMEALVNDLLDVSRVESGKLVLHHERADLRTVMRQAVEDQTAATNRAIALDVPDEPVEVDCDVDRIYQVITNLISNALKYSTPQTEVDVQLSLAGDEALLRVSDTGTGIPPEQLPHIFERFYRAPEAKIWSGSHVGLGLGLYISREIVERHGGRLWAESEPDVGSTFSVALRLAAAPVGSSHAERQAHADAP